MRMDGSQKAQEQEKRPSGSQSLFWVFGLCGVLVGIGLRLCLAQSTGNAVEEWEADHFLRAWEAPHVTINKDRPFLSYQVPHAVQQWTGVQGVEGLRQVGVWISCCALIGVALLAWCLSRWTGLDPGAKGRAACWIAWLWALHPTLLVSSVTPNGSHLLGFFLCITLSGGLLLQGQRTLPGWGLLTLGVLGSFLSGGVVVVAAMTVGLVIYLVPVPPFRAFLGTASAFAVAGALWFSNQGPVDSERPWVPDIAGVHSVLALVEAPTRGEVYTLSDRDDRTAWFLKEARDVVSETPPLSFIRSWARRLVIDLHGPVRFDALTPPLLADVTGWIDVLLRGGLMLFGVAVLSVVRLRSTSAWPRGGAIAGALVLLALTVVTATTPFALASLDVVLLGVAGAGILGSSSAKRGGLRLAFALGGGVVLLFHLVIWQLGPAPSPWMTEHYRGGTEGDYLVSTIERLAGGVESGDDHLTVANGLLNPYTPLLRLPGVALKHAEKALYALPTEESATEVYVRALVENYRIDEAIEIAENAISATPTPSHKAEAMVNWLRYLKKTRRVDGKE